MELLSGISLFGSGYAEQTQAWYKKESAKYGGVEEISAGGDSYTFSAEALRLAQQMTTDKANAANNDDKASTSDKSGKSEAGKNTSTAFAAQGGASSGDDVAEAEQSQGQGGAGGGGGSDSNSEDVQAKIAALQAQLQAALSDGDTSKAASLESQIAALQAQLQQASA